MKFEDMLHDKFEEDNEQLNKLFAEWDAKGLVGCSRMEYHILYFLAAKENVRDILELGPGKGGSTEAMLLGLRGKPRWSMTTVDIDADNKLPLVTSRESLKFVDCNTDRFFKENTQKFDLIFVDANHTDAQAFKDIESSVKILNEHGIVACHDIMNGKDTTDIHRHVKNVAESAGKSHKMIPQFGNGLGLIY